MLTWKICVLLMCVRAEHLIKNDHTLKKIGLAFTKKSLKTKLIQHDFLAWVLLVNESKIISQMVGTFLLSKKIHISRRIASKIIYLFKIFNILHKGLCFRSFWTNYHYPSNRIKFILFLKLFKLALKFFEYFYLQISTPKVAFFWKNKLI